MQLNSQNLQVAKWHSWFEVFAKFQLISKIWLICLIFLPLTKTKCMDPKWSPILELDCLLDHACIVQMLAIIRMS